jgi:chemotaxis protein methyltransferase CheR
MLKPVNLHQLNLSKQDFLKLSRVINETCGIKMPQEKKILLEARLRKRLRTLGMESFEEYSEFFFQQGDAAGELIHLIDVVTTNKTDFFREPQHFELLQQRLLPDLVHRHGLGIERPLRIWSAGCSTGEEPYTLAMVLNEFALQEPGFSFVILATDISTRVLEKAELGIYNRERIEPVPAPLQRRYLLRSKDREANQVRIVPELRRQVNFRRLNFMDEDFAISESIDVIFCRNVLIYFDRETQERLIKRFCDRLRPGRYLFLGHSESINGMKLPLKSLAPSVYQKCLA